MIYSGGGSHYSPPTLGRADALIEQRKNPEMYSWYVTWHRFNKTSPDEVQVPALDSLASALDLVVANAQTLPVHFSGRITIWLRRKEKLPGLLNPAHLIHDVRLGKLDDFLKENNKRPVFAESEWFMPATHWRNRLVYAFLLALFCWPIVTFAHAGVAVAAFAMMLIGTWWAIFMVYGHVLRPRSQYGAVTFSDEGEQDFSNNDKPKF